MEYSLTCLVQTLLKLNRKLQPMVDEIDANRNKWQDLCLSYQQTRRASLTNQSADQSQNLEACENTQDGQQREALMQVQDTIGSPEEAAAPESRNDKPAWSASQSVYLSILPLLYNVLANYQIFTKESHVLP